MAIIELRGLRKEFGDLVAVDDIDLTVESGEIFGFLGPNGAGKSTTINVMLDFTRPTSGEALLFGDDSRRGSLQIRRRSGLLPDGYTLYDRLTGRRHLEFTIDAKGASDSPKTLLERVGIPDAIGQKVGTYSTGMRQRLALAMALVGDPDLLVLDEPHAGLDPNGAREMLNIIREENERGATVFFSSHILEHVEAICDRVAILNEGRIAAEDDIEGLRESLGRIGTISIVLDELDPDVVDALRAPEWVEEVDVEGYTVNVSCGNVHRAEAVRIALEEGATILNIETEAMTLDDMFAAFTTESGFEGSERDGVQGTPDVRPESGGSV